MSRARWNYALPFAILAVVCASPTAFGQEVEWVREFGTTESDIGFSVFADSTGVYVAGRTYGSLAEPNQGSGDVLVRRYDSAGNALWIDQFGSTEVDQAHGVGADSSGIYVAGITFGALPGQVSRGKRDGWVRKYLHNGTEVWTDQFGTGGDDSASAISVHSTGVYVTGVTRGALPGQTKIGFLDSYVRKYLHDGTLVWTIQFGAAGVSTGVQSGGISVDSTGVYVEAQVDTGILVQKFLHDGTASWSRVFGTGGSDLSRGISTHSSGIYVTGNTTGEFPGHTNEGGSRDAFIRKYDPDGNEIWTVQFGQLNAIILLGISVSDAGVYVTGRVNGGLPFPGHTGAGGSSDTYIRQYLHDGTEGWTQQIGTSGLDDCFEISAHSSTVFVTGGTTGALPSQINAGSWDVFLVKLAASDNTPPVADAGVTQSVHVGDLVQLDGTGSFDEETPSEDLFYDWTFLSVPTGSAAILVGADAPTPTFVVDLVGDYVVSLVVTDEGGLSSEPDEMTISSLNAPPNADAGPDQGTFAGDLVFLDGTGSSDPDLDPLTFTWTLIGRPQDSTATLSDSNTQNPSFVPDLPGVYEIQLTLNDGSVDSAPDTVTVLVVTPEDFACVRISEAINLVANLLRSSVTTKGNQVALQQFLKQSGRVCGDGDLQSAIKKLEKGLERVDGCVIRGTPDAGGATSGQKIAKDYLTDCNEQQQVFGLLNEAICALQFELGLGELASPELAQTPIFHEKYYQGERELFGYNPAFVPGVVSFDSGNQPFMRSDLRLQRLSPYTCGWESFDLARAVAEHYPDWDGDTQDVFSASQIDQRVVFDVSGDAYTYLPTKSWTGVGTSLLLHSRTNGEDWDVYPLPAAFGLARLEFQDGNNTLDAPPLLFLMDHGTSQIAFLAPTKNPDGTLTLPAPVALDENSFVHGAGWGANFAASSAGQVFLVWASQLPGDGDGTPTFTAKYDRATGILSDPVSLGFAGTGVPDNHNIPGITIDSEGFLHVVLGAHNNSFTYRRSLVPLSIEGGWTPPETLGGVESGSPADPECTGLCNQYTYVTLLCDQADTLHLVARWAGNTAGYTFYFRIEYLRKRKGLDWEPRRTLVVPFKNFYSNWYQRLSLDEQGRLFLFYIYYGNQLWLDEEQAYNEKFPEEGLQRPEGCVPTLRDATPRNNCWFEDVKAHDPVLLISNDGGDSWRVATSADF